MHDELMLFALDATRTYGEAVARELGTTLAPHEEREFEDGEHKARPLLNVRGRDVYVIQSLYGDAKQSVNDKLVRLLFFLGALKDASAGRLTAIVPYLAYARKDRKIKVARSGDHALRRDAVRSRRDRLCRDAGRAQSGRLSKRVSLSHRASRGRGAFR